MKHLLFLCIGLFFLSSCSESQKSVNIALKKEGKTYLFSLMNKQNVVQQIAKGEMPAMMNSTVIVAEDGKLFMEASKIKTIANILGGSIEIFPKQETSFDGYFIEGETSVFSQSMKNKDTGEIGKIASIIEVRLSNESTEVSYPISWQVTPELKAIENCEIQSLTVKYSQHSDNEFTSKDFVMVNLEDINQFFGGHYSLRYDKNASLLYLEEK